MAKENLDKEKLTYYKSKLDSLQSNKYYLKLDKNLKQIFDMHNFKPQNDFEADAFLRSIYDIDKHKTITIRLKNPVKKQGKDIKLVVADKNNYLDLFYPEVWDQLNVGQKMQATVFAYSNLVEQDIEIINKRPQLVFVCSKTNYDGLSYSQGDQNIINISMNCVILDKYTSPVYVLSSLKHELTHCKQTVTTAKVKDVMLANNKKGISNKNISNYDFSLLSEYGYYFLDCNEIAKQKNLPFEYSHLVQKNPKDLELLFYWQDIKNKYTWQELLSVLYLLDVSEQSAYNKGANFAKTIETYFAKTFDNYKKDCDVEYPNEQIANIFNYLNKRAKFNLKSEDIKEFKKINTILANSIKKDDFGVNEFSQVYVGQKDFFKSANWALMKKVLQIYKDKCITKKIPQSTVDKFKKHTIQELDKDCEWI